MPMRGLQHLARHKSCFAVYSGSNVRRQIFGWYISLPFRKQFSCDSASRVFCTVNVAISPRKTKILKHFPGAKGLNLCTGEGKPHGQVCALQETSKWNLLCQERSWHLWRHPCVWSCVPNKGAHRCNSILKLVVSCVGNECFELTKVP